MVGASTGHSYFKGSRMENKELGWIAEVIEKLQVPQTHNERERLTKILKTVAPALIKVLDWTALSKFSTGDNEEWTYSGHSCNACGQDYYIKENNPEHKETGADRDGNGGEKCRYEELLQILTELQKEEDK